MSDDEKSIDEVLGDAESASIPQSSTVQSAATRALALDNAEANGVAAQRRPTVLVLAGQPFSGKTSAFAAIYERLSRGPFAGRTFAGSATIAGFEARCHDWRTTSGRVAPAMEHTNADAMPWLHLRLKEDARANPPQDLLLGDFDGEYFRQLTRGEIGVSELPFLFRADHIGLVLDGSRISDPSEREAEITSFRYLVNELAKDAEPTQLPASLSVVLTKIDLIDAQDDPSERRAISAALDLARAHVFERNGLEVPLVRLAVRSKTDRYPLGHGLESLLELLSTRPASLATTPAPPISPVGGGFSEFQA